MMRNNKLSKKSITKNWKSMILKTTELMPMPLNNKPWMLKFSPLKMSLLFSEITTLRHTGHSMVSPFKTLMLPKSRDKRRLALSRPKSRICVKKSLMMRLDLMRSLAEKSTTSTVVITNTQLMSSILQSRILLKRSQLLLIAMI